MVVKLHEIAEMASYIAGPLKEAWAVVPAVDSKVCYVRVLPDWGRWDSKIVRVLDVDIVINEQIALLFKDKIAEMLGEFFGNRLLVGIPLHYLNRAVGKDQAYLFVAVGIYFGFWNVLGTSDFPNDPNTARTDGWFGFDERELPSEEEAS